MTPLDRIVRDAARRRELAAAIARALPELAPAFAPPASVRQRRRARRRAHAVRSTIARAIIASGNDLSLARVVREHIAYVMRIVNGSVSDAARLLGLHRRTLQRMLRRRAA